MAAAVGAEDGVAPLPPASDPRAPSGAPEIVLMVVALSVAAGVIHAVAMLTHFREWWVYGVFFLAVTCAQFAWAAWLYRHPADRCTLVYGAAACLAITGVWVVTRTVGLPLGPEAGHPERVGGIDVMASLDQLIIAGLVAASVVPGGRLARRTAWMTGRHAVLLRSMLCSASVFSIVLSGHH